MPIRHGWIVLTSVVSDSDNLCVDTFQRTDGSFGFEQFRADPEDGGAWTPISGFSAARCPSVDDAITAASTRVNWLSSVSLSAWHQRRL
jgi:hypothetical protein